MCALSSLRSPLPTRYRSIARCQKKSGGLDRDLDLDLDGDRDRDDAVEASGDTLRAGVREGRIAERRQGRRGRRDAPRMKWRAARTARCSALRRAARNKV